MRRACLAVVRRASLGVLALAASLVAMMSVGVAMAAACAWVAEPTAGTQLYVHSSPSQSSPRVGSMSRGSEFYGACTESNGWITVSAGQWSYTWTGVPPYDYVDGAYAKKL